QPSWANGLRGATGCAPRTAKVRTPHSRVAVRTSSVTRATLGKGNRGRVFAFLSEHMECKRLFKHSGPATGGGWRMGVGPRRVLTDRLSEGGTRCFRVIGWWTFPRSGTR